MNKVILNAYVSAPGFKKVTNIFIYYVEKDFTGGDHLYIEDIDVAKKLYLSLGEWIGAWEIGGDSSDYGQSGHKGMHIWS